MVPGIIMMLLYSWKGLQHEANQNTSNTVAASFSHHFCTSKLESYRESLCLLYAVENHHDL